MTFVLIIVLIGVLFYLFRIQIPKWFLRRLGIYNASQEASRSQKRRGERESRRSPGEKVDITTVDKRKFDKGQGEYVDFTEEKDTNPEQ
ncbi:hypothetical protein [Porphyromonas endodontalis]|uniref:hypothetical protein n=1 Tax=Porphyromonas endodontalis TaxID=28124 RepID=UPI0036177AF7